MSRNPIPPNELAEYYDSLFSVLEQVPTDSHPAWEFALESVLFGGEGLDDDAIPYGEQQAERNSFKITEYREQYGNGDKVTDFPAIDEGTPRVEDRGYLDSLCIPPESPVSGRVVPIFVGDEELEEAISILAEFPAEPDAERPGKGVKRLLDPDRFPGLSTEEPEAETQDEETAASSDPPSDSGDLKPNELADLYEAFRVFAENIPGRSHPEWKEAIQSIIYGGEYLHESGIAYGEQQAQRNDFKMDSYRDAYGDGEQVLEFPSIETRTISIQSGSGIQTEARVPVAPESGVALPLAVDAQELEDAIHLLSEFPAAPTAQEAEPDSNHLLAIERIATTETGSTSQTQEAGPETTPTSDNEQDAEPDSKDTTSAIEERIDFSHKPTGITNNTYDDDKAEQDSSAGVDSSHVADSSGTASSSDQGKPDSSDRDSSESRPPDPASGSGQTETASEPESAIRNAPNSDRKAEPEQTDTTVLRDEGVGEVSDLSDGSGGAPPSVLDELDDGERKHSDPRAEYAHRKAQQRDPRDVVELGETISLVLKEVDFGSGSPTVMGTKNKLVIFVEEAPRHVSKYDTIRAKIVDFGGKDTSAEAVFLGYED